MYQQKQSVDKEQLSRKVRPFIAVQNISVKVAQTVDHVQKDRFILLRVLVCGVDVLVYSFMHVLNLVFVGVVAVRITLTKRDQTCIRATNEAFKNLKSKVLERDLRSNKKAKVSVVHVQLVAKISKEGVF